MPLCVHHCAQPKKTFNDRRNGFSLFASLKIYDEMALLLDLLFSTPSDLGTLVLPYMTQP